MIRLTILSSKTYPTVSVLLQAVILVDAGILRSAMRRSHDDYARSAAPLPIAYCREFQVGIAADHTGCNGAQESPGVRSMQS